MTVERRRCFLPFIVILALAPLFRHGAILEAGSKPAIPSPGPLTPREEQATFRLLPGFKIELVACEPDIVDPVAFAFDEDNRLYVVEMRGYPNDGVGTGTVTSGRIKLLEDRDGDGFYEKSSTFAEGLRLPTAVMPYKGGVIAGNPPDVIYLKDTDGDGRADTRRVLYTGFNLANIQQMVNGLQWGLDNWVHGCAGYSGGVIRSAERPEAPAVALASRGIRFRPDRPASLEPTSGGGQFGLTADDWDRWFVATNSQHLRHIVLPDHYLRRNPFLPVNAVTLDIPDHGAACKVHRISPFEAWRVERTSRRKGGPDAPRFPPNELVPGGFITSACSPLVYRAGLYPPRFHGNTFVCDPANNLIHRDVLVSRGATFTARRADADCEFLASTDNWFRPVNLVLGPDGAIYLADFYREVIETPLSLPDDIKKKLNLQTRGRGRIWRIVPESYRRDARARPALSRATAAELVRRLADDNAWWRMTAQRLLVERQDQTAVPALRELARKAATGQARVHALWTLHGLGALQEADVEATLHDAVAGVRENAVRLSEPFLSSARMRKRLAGLAGDADARVRFQLAFTLGEGNGPELAAAWARVAHGDLGDSWTQTALLSSAGKSAATFLEALAGDAEYLQGGPAHVQFLARLASLVGARADDAGLVRALSLIPDRPRRWQIALLEGLGQGVHNSQRSLEKLWDSQTPQVAKALARVKPIFNEAALIARSDKKPEEERLGAVRLLGLVPLAASGPALQALLAPQEPQKIQLAAVRALSGLTGPKAGDILLKSWTSYSPIVRREVLEALFAHPERLNKLLAAMEAKKVLAGQLEPSRLDQLRKHPNPTVRARAGKLLAGLATPDRQKVLRAYQAALELKGDIARGRMAFKKTCATCHRLEDVGVQVGADLLAALRNKTPEALLVDILDPSREVDPRFIEYVVTTRTGRVLSGLIAAETASSLTLRRAENAEDTILRTQIESIQATTRSLMPEGLEMMLSREDVADLIAYLLAVGRK
jgi:putative membrane-bound dehydrogenase-like protein